LGNRMRSAFTTNFKMDESDGDTIAYKGVKSQRCWITETATHSMWREST
jgi:hypothetical protein